MSTETRDRIAVRMDQETSRRLEQWYIADNCKSKNEFILKAMNFYIDYLEIDDNKNLLPLAVMTAIDGRMAMQRGAAEKIGGFMESATATPAPEPPEPPEQSRCKVIPFEKVG